MREAILALVAKEPAHGYELRQRLTLAMGTLGEVMNPGQVYVTLSRLESAGLVRGMQVEQSAAPDKKVYEVTPAGRDRVAEWLTDSTWPKVAPVDFHLKLVAARATGLGDPVALIDAQRRELLRRLHDLQRLTVTADHSSARRAASGHDAAEEGQLLLAGAVLRLEADIRWLEACERFWNEKGAA